MRQALELALEALQHFRDTGTRPSDLAMSEDAITAIKEALAQPEQEPVGCIPWHWVDKAKQIADGTIAYPDVERAQQAIALIKILLKSTPPKPEPVAWQRDVGTGRKFMPHGVLPSVGKETGWTPLYTTPPQQERNFCSRCGKRLVDGSIHTCTPPLENT